MLSIFSNNEFMSFQVLSFTISSSISNKLEKKKNTSYMSLFVNLSDSATSLFENRVDFVWIFIPVP